MKCIPGNVGMSHWSLCPCSEEPSKNVSCHRKDRGKGICQLLGSAIEAERYNSLRISEHSEVDIMRLYYLHSSRDRQRPVMYTEPHPSSLEHF
ncbi:hypothetical protein NPIL_2161 [Nephila pilipes]|uniref:Uncharacterized protein n=1 Tax=Nephila pilipes TaxID=299642 RepID=A0A8X6QK46_NEPPI|nr:hypothetical protein NPIL_2161 [Nephila pilipes]